MANGGADWQTRAREQFEELLGGIAETFRAQGAEQWNQGLRRMRAAPSEDAVAALVLELSAPFASRCAVFVFRHGAAEAVASRGFGAASIRFSPNDGAAFRAAIDSRDPVIAVAIASELSETLAQRVGTEFVERVYLFPLTVHGEVRAILFAAGDAEPAPLEFLAGMAAMQMEALTPAPVVKRSDLVGIGGAQPLAPTAKSWQDLTPELQALHLRAQRHARLRVAELRLEHGEALRRGLSNGDIYDALRQPIDQAREEFRRDYISASPTMVDYLYLELARGLAQEKDGLLGTHFPGPLV